jgi:carbamoyltransferase
MKDQLNARVKFRQAFRPFAPIVLAERANEVFECEAESPFMLVAAHVRPEWRERVPAIVHVDGTARIQTVRREHNERLYRLLQEFDKLTGVPVLLNTSFNIRGQPIVETPQDAVECFLSTGMDCLALHDMLITKNLLYRMVSPVMKTYYEFSAMARSGGSSD